MYGIKNICYKYNIYKSDSAANTGYLSVAVHNRLNNRPIAFAQVSVYLLNIRGVYGEEGGADMVIRHMTDENGEIPLIELPVIDRSPTSQYYMTINHFGYYPVNLLNVQIYSNVTTEYTVLLTPRTTSNSDYEFLITPEFF